MLDLGHDQEEANRKTTKPAVSSSARAFKKLASLDPEAMLDGMIASLDGDEDVLANVIKGLIC